MIATATQLEPEVRNASLDEYFEHEFNSVTKNEYINRQIVPKAYSSVNHGLIATNFGCEIGNAVRGQNTRVFIGDRMVTSISCNENYYPDVVVVRGKPEHFQHKNRPWGTLNPTAVAEVLSYSTDKFDRTGKWACYREIKSLRQYFLVSQHEPYIEFYTREDDSARWIYAYAQGLETSVPVLGEDISLQEIYALVDWENIEK